MDKQLPNENGCRDIGQLISQALDGLQSNPYFAGNKALGGLQPNPYFTGNEALDGPCFTGNEAYRVMQRAYNGDMEAMTVLFSYVAMYAKPSEMLPEEFLLYFHWKALQLNEYKDINVLSHAKYEKKPGKEATQVELVKMVIYLMEKKGYSRKDAFSKVAKDLDEIEDTSVNRAYYKWHGKRPENENVAPHKFVKNLGWGHHIGSDEEYELARQNVLDGKYTLFRLMEIMSSAVR
jgi:hypothetical protein